MEKKGPKKVYIKSAKLVFRIEHAASLKDKRHVSRSLIDKSRRKFNVSISEVDTQDAHKILTIGVAVVSGSMSHAQKSLDDVIRYLETSTDAELTELDIL